MIEYLLLFGLGFLTASLAALLLAPAVYKRVVRFAEDRLKATVPLSAQEIRAERDAAKATFAAESARNQQVLKRERDKSVERLVESETANRAKKRIESENAELQGQIADMNVEAADMRTEMRAFEARIERLKAALDTAESDSLTKAEEIRTLVRQLDTVSTDVDSLKTDLITRQTEIDSLKSRIATLRDERETLRGQLKTETGRVREMELRFGRDESRIRQLESRLTSEVAANADKDNIIERRGGEIDRLKTKLRAIVGDSRETARPTIAGFLQAARKGKTMATETQSPDDALAPVGASLSGSAAAPVIGGVSRNPSRALSASHDIDTARLAENARQRVNALSERLVNGQRSRERDQAMREEIAGIAATMVTVTATAEGKSSPIRTLLAKTAERTSPTGRKSLAHRALDMLHPE